jgi:phosphate starvation-inducible PhoH-like protein
MIVTGDVTQIDLPENVASGLIDAMDKLAAVRGIAMIELHRSDIVRHRLVQNIVEAYEANGVDPEAKPGRKKDPK